jgi:chromosome segregation ATPase
VADLTVIPVLATGIALGYFGQRLRHYLPTPLSGSGSKPQPTPPSTGTPAGSVSAKSDPQADITKSLKSLKGKIRLLTQQLETQTQEIEQIQQQLQAETAAKQQVEQHLTEVTQRSQELDTQLQEERSRSATVALQWQATQADLEGQMQQLQSELALKAVTVEHLQTQLTSQGDTLQQIQSETAQKEGRIQQLEAELLTQVGSLQHLQSELVLIQATEQQLRSELLLKQETEQQLHSDLVLQQEREQQLRSELLLKQETEHQLHSDLVLQQEREQALASELTLKLAAEQQLQAELALKLATEEQLRSQLMQQTEALQQLQAERQHLIDQLPQAPQDTPSDWQETLAQREQQYQDLLEHLSTQNAALADLQAINEALTLELTQAQTSREPYEAAIAERDQLLQYLQAQLQEKEMELSQLQSASEELAVHLEQALRQDQTETSPPEVMPEWELLLQDMQAQLLEKENALSQLQSAYDECALVLNQTLHDRVESPLSIPLEDSPEAVAEWESLLQDLQTQLAEKEAALGQLQAGYDALTLQLDQALQAQATVFAIEPSADQVDISDERDQRWQDLQIQSAEKDELIAQLRTSQEQLILQLDQVDQQINHHQLNEQQLHDRLVQRDHAIMELQQQLQDLQASYAQPEAEFESHAQALFTQISEKDELIEQLRTTNESLLQQIELLHDSIDQPQVDPFTAVASVPSAAESITIDPDSVDTLIRDLQEQLQQKEQEILRLRQGQEGEPHEYENQLEELQTEKNHVERQLKQTQQRLETMVQQNVEVRQRSLAFERQVRERDETIEELEIQTDQLAEQLTQAQAEIKRLQERDQALAVLQELDPTATGDAEDSIGLS